MAKSILNTEKGVCFMCGCTGPTHIHHIFFGVNRPISDREGFTAYLCPGCHEWEPWAVHVNRSSNYMLKAICQFEYEKTHSREEFMDLIGKNYLSDAGFERLDEHAREVISNLLKEQEQWQTSTTTESPSADESQKNSN